MGLLHVPYCDGSGLRHFFSHGGWEGTCRGNGNRRNARTLPPQLLSPAQRADQTGG
eukprot:gene16951-biopygen12841